jgi:hypothetical protein
VSDAFIEVDEQLRSARLQSMFRRGWPYLAGLLALVLVAALAVWGWRAHQGQAAGDSSQRYQDAMQALSLGDTRNASAKFDRLAQEGTPTYRALALMQEAGIKLKAGDGAGAAALFDRAASAAHDPVLADGARLRAAFILMDTAPYDTVRDRLKPLAGAHRPFQTLAREGLAIAELANGRAAEAKGDFQLLSLSPDVSDAARARANAALAMIGTGAAANLGAIAHAAVGLKAAPPPTQQGLSPEQLAALRAQLQAQGQAQGQPQGQTEGQGAAPTTSSSGAPQ